MTLIVSVFNIPTSRTGCSLFDYAQPQGVLFQPSKAYMKSARRPFELPAPFPGVSTSGGATPMPDRTPSSTPAWDPSSRTPQYFPFLFRLTKAYYLQIYRTRAADASSPTPSSLTPLNPQHPLLDERLVGAQLKAIVNDGDNYKDREVFVSIVKVEGVLSLRHCVYNVPKGLSPAWVSIKSPNPTRDNGLLMVIKGERCGTYVRRIHHRYHSDSGNKQALILLAVVKRVDGAADALTGEQLELGPDSLCLAFETGEDKKLNANLMTSLRENARKKRG
jgi:hypothetical protein